jgi:hypothetical protein
VRKLGIHRFPTRRREEVQRRLLFGLGPKGGDVQVRGQRFLFLIRALVVVLPGVVRFLVVLVDITLGRVLGVG